MSRLLIALRGQIDQRVADYVDASIAAVRTDYDAKLAAQATEIANLKSAIVTLNDQLAAVATDPLDETRYILTKAKVVRLMKHLGIYDEPAQ